MAGEGALGGTGTWRERGSPFQITPLPQGPPPPSSSESSSPQYTAHFSINVLKMKILI